MTTISVVRERPKSRRKTECARFELQQWTHPGELSLHSLRRFATGEVMAAFESVSSSSQPTRLSVQVSESEHIELAPEFLRYMNHSCRPNAMFDVASRVVRAVAPIEPGDEITFFYPSTEWEMASPFQCECGMPECLETIQGAAFLPGSVLTRYRLSEHIEILAERRDLALDEKVS